MGQTESKSHGTDFLKEFNSKFSFYKEINDKRFGEIQVLLKKINDIIIYINKMKNQIFNHKVEERFIAKRGHLCNNSEDFDDFMK